MLNWSVAVNYLDFSAWWNGSEMPLGKIQVPVTDRAFLFGDAVYEVIRIYGRRLWLGDEHFARLRRSLREMHIAYDCNVLEKAAAQLLKTSPMADGSLYIQVTRGAGPRSHVPVDGMQPNALMYVQNFDETAWKQKMQRGISVTMVPDERWHRCDIKSVNLLGNCMAAMAAKSHGFDEAILTDDKGLVSEGTHATFLWVRDGDVCATPLSNRILPGITRAKVRELCRLEHLKFSEQVLPQAELMYIEEALLCGTTTEVMPIVSIDGKKVGNGQPGPLAVRLQKAYRRQISEKLTNDFD